MRLAKTFAEFFAGIGLGRLGLEQEGWRALFANDIDAKKLEMYAANFPDADRLYVLKDIRNLSPQAIPTVMLATASFPCTDLSLAGRRAGLSGPNSSAFWGFINVLRGMGRRRPPMVLLENVPGFLASRGGSDFEEALHALDGLGYAVDACMVDAAWFVPQSRRRVFIAGVKRPPDGPVSRLEGMGASRVRPAALAKFISNHPQIHWSLRSLPDPPRGGRRLEGILEQLPADAPQWWTKARVDRLLDQMSPRHRRTADRMITNRSCSFGTMFRRTRHGHCTAELRTDGLAGCLLTPRGGSGRQILFKAGRGCCQARLLAPRECARLMEAADFKITTPANQALAGFGDAVCVPAVKWLARNYLEHEFRDFQRESSRTRQKNRLGHTMKNNGQGQIHNHPREACPGDHAGLQGDGHESRSERTSEGNERTF